MLNRHEYREKIVFSLYQHLLLHKSLYDCFMNNFEEDEINDYVRAIRDDILENKDKYIEEISEYLHKWTFDRLNLVEQAILLETVSEIKLKLNDEAVVIDEAIILAKEYCDDESYKFINGVLDNICNRSA
ncbi:MAG: transcription antitermination factor NusB [Erysipelotrichaceae bacterium]|nr:transcription antitermination factor NusB [Erysipelotrichaceae bacterium]